MAEQWENIIEYELQFYADFQKHYEDLQEKLYENELNIQYPITHFNPEEGRIHRSCPGTEEQAIRRIEVRESVEAAMKRIEKRINRLNNALSQLDEEEQNLIGYFYLDGTPENYIKKIFGFSNMKELHKAKREALLKVYKIYEKEREDAMYDFRKMLKEERIKRAALFKEQQIKQKFA